MNKRHKKVFHGFRHVQSVWISLFIDIHSYMPQNDEVSTKKFSTDAVFHLKAVKIHYKQCFLLAKWASFEIQTF